VPFDAGLKLPCHRFAIGGQASILDRWNLSGENKGEIAFGVPACERFIEQPRALTVLGANTKMRIEQGGTLPPQKLQRTTSAAFGGLIN